MKYQEFIRSNHTKQQIERQISSVKSEIKANKNFIYNYFKLSERKLYLQKNIDLPKNILATTYFTKKKDPQRKNLIKNNDYNLISKWCKSIIKLKLFGIILHDDLSTDFTKRYANSHIQFVYCELGNLSNNDERFFLYLLLLREVNVEKIFFTDGFDVEFKKNPFDSFNEKNENKVFVGLDQYIKIRHSYWMLYKIKNYIEHSNININYKFYNAPLFNAGIIGGKHSIVNYLIGLTCHYLMIPNNCQNHNMTALNLALFYHFVPANKNISPFNNIIIHSFNHLYKLMSTSSAIRIKYNKLKLALNRNKIENDLFSKYIFGGYPLNSAYKSFKHSEDVYIIHK